MKVRNNEMKERRNVSENVKTEENRNRNSQSEICEEAAKS
jgi:hypothetical protein